VLEPSDETLQKLVRGLVAAGSSPDPSDLAAVRAFYDESVIDGHDNFAGPPGIYATVTRINPATVLGLGQRLYFDTADDAVLLDAETSYDVCGEWDVQWHGFTDEKGVHGPSPFDYANRFRLWCRSATGIAQMLHHGLTFVECTDPRDLSALMPNEKWERRSGCEFKAAYRQRYTAPVSTIGRVPFGSDSDLLPDGEIVIE